MEKMSEIAYRINQKIEDLYLLFETKERAFNQHPLNNQQHVMMTLRIRYSMDSPTEIAKKMGITKSAISQQLKLLEDKGYIKRERNLKDKRSITITLTKKGKQYEQDMNDFYEKVAKKFDQHLSTDEMEQMLVSLKTLENIVRSL